VCSNEAQGTQLATEYLYKHGHRNIAHITYGGMQDVSRQVRTKEFTKAISLLGLNAKVSRTWHVLHTDNYYEMIGKIIRSGASGLICTGETISMQAAYALYIFGKKVPEDISLITYEQTNVSRYCFPPHTTLSQNFEHIAKQVLDLLERIRHEPAKAKDVVIDYKLIERDSVCDIS
jgi:LacI family transcriptional regulator, galactose operon repressor